MRQAYVAKLINHDAHTTAHMPVTMQHQAQDIQGTRVRRRQRINTINNPHSQGPGTRQSQRSMHAATAFRNHPLPTCQLNVWGIAQPRSPLTQCLLLAKPPSRLQDTPCCPAACDSRGSPCGLLLLLLTCPSLPGSPQSSCPWSQARCRSRRQQPAGSTPRKRRTPR